MEDARPGMREIGNASQSLADWFVQAVDRDTNAFSDVIAARRLPKKTEQEQQTRLEAIERANQAATRVPLVGRERAVAALEWAGRVARDVKAGENRKSLP